jgi:hypothetical protein
LVLPQQQLLLPGQHLEIQEQRSPTETSLADRWEPGRELAARVELSLTTPSSALRACMRRRVRERAMGNWGVMVRDICISLSSYLNY